MVICCDFDGTIVEHDYPRIGKIKENAVKVINSLYNNGHSIIVWTCRYLKEDLDNMVKFLVDNKIKFHKINENVKLNGFKPFPKVYADIYIDDRNIFCDNVNWFDIETYFLIKGVL